MQQGKQLFLIITSLSIFLISPVAAWAADCQLRIYENPKTILNKQEVRHCFLFYSLEQKNNNEEENISVSFGQQGAGFSLEKYALLIPEDVQAYCLKSKSRGAAGNPKNIPKELVIISEPKNQNTSKTIKLAEAERRVRIQTMALNTKDRGAIGIPQNLPSNAAWQPSVSVKKPISEISQFAELDNNATVCVVALNQKTGN